MTTPPPDVLIPLIKDAVDSLFKDPRRYPDDQGATMNMCLFEVINEVIPGSIHRRRYSLPSKNPHWNWDDLFCGDNQVYVESHDDVHTKNGLTFALCSIPLEEVFTHWCALKKGVKPQDFKMEVLPMPEVNIHPQLHALLHETVMRCIAVPLQVNSLESDTTEISLSMPRARL